MQENVYNEIMAEVGDQYWAKPTMDESVAAYIARCFLPIPMTDRGEIVHKGMKLNGKVVGGITVGFTCFDVYNDEGDPIAECLPRGERIRTEPQIVEVAASIPWGEALIYKLRNLDVADIAKEFGSLPVRKTENWAYDPSDFYDACMVVETPDGHVIEIVWTYDNLVKEWSFNGMRFGTEDEVLIDLGEQGESIDDGMASHPKEFLGTYAYRYGQTEYRVKVSCEPEPRFWQRSKARFQAIRRNRNAWVFFDSWPMCPNPFIVAWGYDPDTGEWEHAARCHGLEETMAAIEAGRLPEES